MKAIFEKYSVGINKMSDKEKTLATSNNTDSCFKYKFLGIVFLKKYQQLGSYQRKHFLFNIPIFQRS